MDIEEIVRKQREANAAKRFAHDAERRAEADRPLIGSPYTEAPSGQTNTLQFKKDVANVREYLRGIAKEVNKKLESYGYYLEISSNTYSSLDCALSMQAALSQRAAREQQARQVSGWERDKQEIDFINQRDKYEDDKKKYGKRLAQTMNQQLKFGEEYVTDEHGSIKRESKPIFEAQPDFLTLYRTHLPEVAAVTLSLFKIKRLLRFIRTNERLFTAVVGPDFARLQAICNHELEGRRESAEASLSPLISDTQPLFSKEEAELLAERLLSIPDYRRLRTYFSGSFRDAQPFLQTPKDIDILLQRVIETGLNNDPAL